MRVNPTILTQNQLECVCELYKGALLEHKNPEPDQVYIKSPTKPQKKYHEQMAHAEIEKSHLNFLVA